MKKIEGFPCPICDFPYNPDQPCAKCFACSLKDKVEIVSPQMIFKNAAEHGWHDKSRQVPEILALIHSEVSEALEAYRNAVPKGEKGWVGEELADVVIRVFDAAVELDIDIIEEVEKKHKFNKTRPYRHGNKKA